MEGGDVIETGEEDAYGHRKLGGVGELVSLEVKRRTGFDIMYQPLAYLMRSGARSVGSHGGDVVRSPGHPIDTTRRSWQDGGAARR